MFLENKIINIKVNSHNRRWIKEVVGRDLTYGEHIEILQKQIPRTSRILVKCKCDFCGITFERRRVDIHNKTYCGLECRNKNFISINPNPKKEKIAVNCHVCKQKKLVNEALFKKQEFFLCSRKCYSIHRSNMYHGDKLYNYQNLFTNCNYCDKEFKIIKSDLLNREKLFCTQDCYWKYRKENFKEFFITHKHENKIETNPERLVREYLEMKNIKFIQEKPIDDIYYADFFLEDHNVILEVYGDYWHSNPKIYGNGKGKRKINETQKKILKRDAKKEGYYKHKKYRFAILWESEIEKDIDHYFKNKILKLDD